MAEFEFSLEKVLKVRSIKEEKAQNKFFQVKKEEKKIEEKLKDKELLQQKLYNFMRENNSSLEEAIQARDFLYLNREKIKKIKVKLSLQKKEVKKHQEELIARRKKRKILESLKEKEYNKFYSKLLKEEQKIIDDIAQRVY